MSGRRIELSPTSCCIPTSAEKCPRVYPRTTGDLMQHPEPHSNGRYIPAVHLGYNSNFRAKYEKMIGAWHPRLMYLSQNSNFTCQ